MRIGPEKAACAKCALEIQCQRGKHVEALDPIPKGLMLIGEGPGATELARGEPFVGAAGQHLNELLAGAGIAREACHLTNATLCFPPREGSKAQSFDRRFPSAVPACLPRLEAELEIVRPKVVVTLGSAAMLAATGSWIERNRHEAVTCAECQPVDRKIGPAIACATGGCSWYELVPAGADAALWREQLIETHQKKCPLCGAAIHRLRLKRIKCLACGGRKKRVVTEQVFKGAGHTLLGKNGIAGALFLAEDLPLRWDRYGVKYVITTLHPSFLLRSDDSGDASGLSGQFASRVVVDHLEKAKTLVDRDHVFDLAASYGDQPAQLDAFLADARLVVVDVETNARSPWDVTELRCVGFDKGAGETLVLDTREAFQVDTLDGLARVRVRDRALVDALVRAFTGLAGPWFEAFNGEYDWIVLRRFLGVEVTRIGGDGRLAHRALWPDEPHTLGHVASALTEAPFWKPPKGKNAVDGFEDWPALALYNAKDCRVTSLALARMAGVPTTEPLETLFPTDVPVAIHRRGGLLETLSETEKAYAVDVALYPIAIRMQYDGIPIDLDTLRAVAAQKQPEADELERWLIDYAGPLPTALQHNGEQKRYGVIQKIPTDQIKLGSPAQLSWALYHPEGPCRLIAPSRTETGAPSTDKDALAKLADHEFVQTLLRWRDLNKTLSTYIYGDGLILRGDGRIHPSWKYVPVTGRWSSEPNFQNWPLWLRAAVKAPAGWKIIGADYSQLEARIMAALCGDPELIRRCRDADESRKLEPDWDPHSFVASQFFGTAFTELALDDPLAAKRRKSLREVIKSVFYGLNYGAGAAKVHETIYKKGYQGIPITIQVVQQAIDTIFTLFPGILAWREEALRTAQDRGEVRTALLNRWRYFPKDVPAPVAWNFPIQGTGADIVNLRFLVYARALAAQFPRAYPIAQVHDAIYTIAPEEDAEAVARLKEQTLSIGLSLVPGAPEMPFVASAKIGQAWDEVS